MSLKVMRGTLLSLRMSICTVKALEACLDNVPPGLRHITEDMPNNVKYYNNTVQYVSDITIIHLV